jgi:hypothetical protein
MLASLRPLARRLLRGEPRSAAVAAVGEHPGRTDPIVSLIERCTTQAIIGWAVHPSGLRAVRVILDGEPVGEATRGLPRPDVAAALGEAPHSATSGFLFAFPSGAFTGRTAETMVCIEFEAEDGTTDTAVERLMPFGPVGWEDDRTTPDPGPLSPFPPDVVGALRRLRPAIYPSDASWSEALVCSAVDDIVAILEQRAEVRPVLRYGLYLRSLVGVLDFIGDEFPLLNPGRDLVAKDRFALATSPVEMLCIAHHLYVLRSHGLEGSLVECGCYKGFSTCCLSHACASLGIHMDAFDSFSGLPPSSDGYYEEGDFRGTLDEVRDNLRTLGRLDQVTLHQGYFADTVPSYQRRILCLWMDVDLTSSAADVMGLLPQLPMSGAVFSHECDPGSFVSGRPVPDSTLVMPPIVEAFVRDGREPHGQFLVNNLGVIHDRTRGIPVLIPEHVGRIARAGPRPLQG